jgi:hypothetical protein
MVPIPTRPETHIQNRAPGPPAVMAVATPAMLPLPTMPPTAVIRAPKGLMSPSPLAGRNRALMAGSRSRPCTARRRIMR